MNKKFECLPPPLLEVAQNMETAPETLLLLSNIKFFGAMLCGYQSNCSDKFLNRAISR